MLPSPLALLIYPSGTGSHAGTKRVTLSQYVAQSFSTVDLSSRHWESRWSKGSHTVTVCCSVHWCCRCLTVKFKLSNPGTGGRVGAKGATLSQYVAQSIASRKPDPYEKDPRGAILRHAKEAEENPYWIDTAYSK